MRLNYLRISGFRGINAAIKLEPNGKSVLLVANNGNGKTSILQAVEWGLFGELPCLEGEEFKREDALVNLFAEQGTALVEMGIENENGEILEIVRQRSRLAKTSGKSTINVNVDGAPYNGRKAEEKIGQFLDFSIEEYNTMVNLHQEVVREIIEGNEESRDKAINKILGIDTLSNFEEVVTKHVHQSSTANKSMRGMQKIVNELGIQRETTEKTKKDEEKAFEKIKAKLIDRGIDIAQTGKESDRLFTATVSEMLTTAHDLGLDQLEMEISNLQKKTDKPIEVNIDEAIEVKRNLRSAIQSSADKVLNELNELDFLEKQHVEDLRQIAELKIDIYKDNGNEFKTLEIGVTEIANELCNLQTRESGLLELRNDVTPVLERLDNVAVKINNMLKGARRCSYDFRQNTIVGQTRRGSKHRTRELRNIQWPCKFSSKIH